MLWGAPASAAPQWLNPSPLAPGGRSPQVAMNGVGDAVVVWEQQAANKIIRSASRPAAGTFAPPADLSLLGRDAEKPQVGIDRNGGAVAVWRRFDGTNWVVQAVTRSAGGSFSSAVNLSQAGRDADDPQVAVNPDGDAVVMWQRSDGANTIVQAAVRPAGAAFSPAVNFSQAGRSAQLPQVAIDVNGAVAAVWRRFDGMNWVVQGALRRKGSLRVQRPSRRSGSGAGPLPAAGRAERRYEHWRQQARAFGS